MSSVAPRDIKDFASSAKSLSGESLVSLIQEVLSSDHIFSFGELLLVPSVQELHGSQYESAIKSLELFAYGTLKDYTGRRDSFIQLTDSQIGRLKLLTLVSLASQEKMLTYTTLHDELDTTSNRELEDIVIEAVYHGLVAAKIDQKNQILRIVESKTRDIAPTDVDSVIADIFAWKMKCADLISTVQESSSELSNNRRINADELEALRTVVGSKVKQLMYGDDSQPGGHKGSFSSIPGFSWLGGRPRPKRSRGDHGSSVM